MADDDPLANLRKPTEEARVDLEHMPDAESGPSEDAPGFVVAGTNPVDLDGVAVDLFELPAFDWGVTPWPNQALRVRAVVDAAGEVVANLAWEAPETDSPDVCVYRVLFRDGDRPDDECTDVQGTLTLTCGLGAEDAAAVNPPESAVRFYEVWCYRGVSTQAALKSSPYPLAAAALVWPPSGVDLSFDHGQIVAAWRDVPDASQQFRWAKQSTQTARGYIPTPDECETAPGGGSSTGTCSRVRSTSTRSMPEARSMGTWNGPCPCDARRRLRRRCVRSATCASSGKRVATRWTCAGLGSPAWMSGSTGRRPARQSVVTKWE